MLLQLLQDNLNKSLIAHAVKEVEALRYLLSQIKNVSIDLKRDLNDEEVVSCIRRQVKQLQESVILFKQQNRDDLVGGYSSQIDIYLRYLPKELGDEELTQEIKKLLGAKKQNANFNPKQFIGTAVSSLKDRASPQRIVSVVNNLIQ